ncbi:unnamed protein product [Victoria cruziana]
MPGPGPHLVYSLGVGTGLMHLSGGWFTPHHCLVYALNSFLGPDLGSFSEWLTSSLGAGEAFGSSLMDFLHHPFYYILILGVPLAFFYSWLSKVALHRGFLGTISGMPLKRRQCLFLVAAGSFSHFFLDHLFEENGRSPTYLWILSTGWWQERAPNNPDAVMVVGILTASLLIGFVHINSTSSGKSLENQTSRSVKLIVVIVLLYCLWCLSQLYWRNPPQPPVGEEADLGVFVFLGVYFFLPHVLCIASIDQKEQLDVGEQLPI